MAVVHTEAPTSTSRILAAATKLFAEYGYEGVSTRQLATNTGLNVSTINHHVGTKRELYVRVIEELYGNEESLVNGILDDIDDDVMHDKKRFQSALAELVIRLLDFAKDNPYRQRLYVQCWLEQDNELREREAELTLRLYRRLSKILKRGQEFGTVREDLDIGNFLRSFDFMIFSYFTSGAFSWRTLRTDPLQPSNLQRFQDYLLDYTKQMLEVTP